MAVGIGINKSSLMAQRRLGEATAQNSKLSEQLSSGLRINRASDDAAGLAISSALNANSKVFTQGIRNLNDGVSLLSVADSAISALAGITTRLSELANQASNGSYNSTQRSALDAEAQALSKEYTRIIQTTKFNNISVLSGDLASGLRLQAGYGTDGSIFSNLGGAKGTAVMTQSATGTYATGIQDISLGDIDNDGILDMMLVGTNEVVVRRGDGAGGFGAATSYSLAGTSGQKGALYDMNNDGNLDAVIISTLGANTYASVRLGNGDGSFGATFATTIDSGGGGYITGLSVTDTNNDGKLDVLIHNNSNGTVVAARGNGDGTFTTGTSYASLINTTPAYTGGNYLQTGDLNGDGIVDMAVISNGYFTAAQLQVRLGRADGTFGSATTTVINPGGSTSGASFNMADMDGDGKLDIVFALGVSQDGEFLKGNGNGTFATGVSFGGMGSNSYNLEVGDMNGDGILDIIQLGFDSGALTIRTGKGLMPRHREVLIMMALQLQLAI